jgi:hypothetical protein
MNSSRFVDIRTLILAVLVLVMGSGSLSAQDSRDGLLRIDSVSALEGVVTMGSEPLDSDLAASPMLCDLGKIAGVLNSKDLARLRRELGPEIELPEGIGTVGLLELTRSGETKLLSIARDHAGQIYLLQDSGSMSGHLLAEELIRELPLNQAILAGVDREQAEKKLRSGRLDLPYFESMVQLDGKTRRARLKRQYPDLSRNLSDEHMQVRLPVNRKSAELPGVLVWVSPTPNGQIPRIFESACDELNLIAIGVDNNGNTRELTDRLQIHLDSIATIGAYVRIHPRRVYITGMSGGGRCSGILQLAFPDVFMGTVPIVGLDSYHRTPTGKAGEYWPERLAKPGGRWFKMLEERRFACISGTMDFNAPEMEKRTAQMQADGLDVRLDMIEGMGHTMPSAEQFADALRWVDELQQLKIKQATQEAADMLSKLKERFGDEIRTLPLARKQLIQITIEAPWSDAAWEAAQLLGLEE